ncbi:substrate-binding domain-containing protein [Oscillospiraceae bacterium OttesenSCG-928-G22]|nr:substrate-binding domain-containing protein [Oscillospiraceae bacterium OttesenSCG-928-G22]
MKRHVFRLHRLIAALLAAVSLLLLPACDVPAEPSAGDASAYDPPAQTQNVPEHLASYQPANSELWDRLDGSTATIPLSEALYMHFTGGNPRDAAYAIRHYKTDAAYENLLNGLANIIFVTYPSEDEQKRFADAGAEMEIVPVVKDAFVLFVNAENPVTSLTQAELRGIYSGGIENWAEVGGNDLPIVPYQRPINSGSQTLFLKLLMKDTLPLSPTSEQQIASMGDIIDVISEYDNAPAAIGYSVFYFANEMYGNDNIRFLGVDGVLPSKETIAAGDYPLETFYYAVLRADTPADHPARALLAFLLSDDGQRVAESAGYIPLRPLP